jgi:hypothetical protein
MFLVSLDSFLSFLFFEKVLVGSLRVSFHRSVVLIVSFDSQEIGEIERWNQGTFPIVSRNVLDRQKVAMIYCQWGNSKTAEEEDNSSWSVGRVTAEELVHECRSLSQRKYKMICVFSTCPYTLFCRIDTNGTLVTTVRVTFTMTSERTCDNS